MLGGLELLRNERHCSIVDIISLQETYSTVDVENIWKSQLKGDLFFAHGSDHSKGVLILIKDKLDFELLSSSLDSQGF